MAGCAKSKLDKSHARKRVHDALMAQAVKAYNLELKKPRKERVGLHRICLRYAAQHYQDTGEAVKLCHMTLKRLAAGGNTRKKANAERAWLNDAEVNVVIEFINEMAACGFPVSHTCLKEAVGLICGARLGEEFPVMGVGKNWTYRFLKKYADHIKISQSQALEDK